MAVLPAKIGSCDVISCLARGSFSQVYEARDLQSSQKCAVKVFDENLSKDFVETEIERWQKQGHPFLLKYIKSFEDKQSARWCIMTELCDKSLRDLLNERKSVENGEEFPEDKVAELLAMIILALESLHNFSITHGALKPENILLKSGVIKLGDFGLTHLMKALSEEEMIYTAPEVLATAKTIYGEKKVPQFTQQSDIYSIGRVLLEMCNLQLSDDQSQQKIPERYSKTLQLVIQWMLEEEPRLRPCAPWISMLPYLDSPMELIKAKFVTMGYLEPKYPLFVKNEDDSHRMIENNVKKYLSSLPPHLTKNAMLFLKAKSQIYQRDNFAQRRGSAEKTLQDYEKFREMREIQKVIEELEAEKKQEQSKTEPAGTDIAEDPKEPEVLPLEPETSGTSEALEEIQATNEMIATVKSLFRNPPTPEEKQEHQRLLGNLKDNQKRAVGCLGEIVKDMFKGGEVLLTTSGESKISYLPMLMTKKWFKPEDVLTIEVPVPIHLQPENVKDFSSSQLTELLNADALKLKERIRNVTKIDPSKIAVIPPKVTGSTGTLQYQPNFQVSLISDDKEPPEQIPLEDGRIVNLTRIEDAKKKQVALFELTPDDFDSRGDIEFPTPIGEEQKRGGMVYNQPSNKWVRVGLSVLGKYDNRNNDWLMMNGNPGEWAVGYHGSSLTGNKGIASERLLKPGSGQAYENDIDMNPLSTRKGKQCGKGSYFASDIETPVEWGYSKPINGRYCVFQVRLKPSQVRIPETMTQYRIINNPKYARPFGICIKEE